MKIKFYCHSRQEDMFDNHSTIFSAVDETQADSVTIAGDNKFVVGKVYEFEITGPVNIQE